MQDAQDLLRVGNKLDLQWLTCSTICYVFGTVQALRPVKFMGRFGEWAGSKCVPQHEIQSQRSALSLR